jgi:CheY-like chemotaxis protein/predicted transcriptional regulator
MLDVLSQHGIRMKKTNLASKAGLNYNVCLRYIQMLNSLGWIEVDSEVSITEVGKGVFAKLLDVSKARATNTGDDNDDDDHDDVCPSNLGDKSIEYSCSSYLSLTQMKPSSSSSSVTEEKQRALQAKKRTANSEEKKKIIMIVDDEEDIAQTYEYFLLAVGYEAKKFIDPRSALNEYVSNPFLYDLLILDIRMQDINGLQLYQSIKAINPACRAIFVSALDAAREVVSVLPGTKPQNIMRKPVSKEQLVSAVKGALAQ